MLTVIKIKKEYPQPIDVGIKYYTILNTLNNLGWAPLEIKFLAFTALKGFPPLKSNRDIFCKEYNCAINTVGGIKSRMLKKGFLIKEGDNIKVHPQLYQDFTNPLLIQLNIWTNQ